MGCVGRYGYTLSELGGILSEEPVMTGSDEFSDLKLKDVEGRLSIQIGALHSWYTCRYRRYCS